MSPWTPVIVTVVLGISGLGIQALLLAYFIGKMKEQQNGQKELVAVFQEFTREAIGALTDRMRDLDKMAMSAGSDRASITARLTAVERNTDGLQSLRESFARHEGAFESFKGNVESHNAKVDRELTGIHAQLANLATGRAGEVRRLGSNKAKAAE